MSTNRCPRDEARLGWRVLLMTAAVAPLLSSSNRWSAVRFAEAFNPDTSGWLMENTYQVSDTARLLYFFVSLGVLAAAGLAFVLLIFLVDCFEKRSARQADPERCIRHIRDFEDRQCGRVRENEKVLDYHYFPNDKRPDYVITNEMASVSDQRIRYLRQQALQRRQVEYASRFVVQSSRSQMRLTTSATSGGPSTPPQQPLGLSTAAQKGKQLEPAVAAGTRSPNKSFSRPGTPMRPVALGGGLTNSATSSQQQSIGVQGGVFAGRGVLLEDDPDYFGLDEDLDFELGS